MKDEAIVRGLRDMADNFLHDPQLLRRAATRIENMANPPEVEEPKERLARITIRNPDLVHRVVVEVCGRREVLEAGEKIDLALAEKDRCLPQRER